MYEVIRKRSDIVENLVVDILDIAEKHNIQYYVKDWSFYGLGRNPHGATVRDTSVIYSNLVHTEEQFQTIISHMFRTDNPYIHHNAYAGNFGYDEPWLDELGTIAWQAKYYKEAMESSRIQNGEVLINLLPAYVANGSAQFGGSNGTYEQYMETYLNDIAEPYLGYVCWDFYPFLNNNTIREQYLYNYELAADKCKGKDIELRIIIQAKGDADATRNIYNIGELRYQIYSGMAFGVKEFIYFTYSAGDNSALYNYTDQTYSAVYDYAKQVNNEVHNMEDVYNQYEWESVMYKLADESVQNAMFCKLATQQKRGICEGLSVSACTQDTLVGIFNAKNTTNRRQKAYMLVNGVDPTGQSEHDSMITVDFESTVTAVSVWRLGKQEIIPIRDHQCTFMLGPGEGIFLIPLK